MDPVERALEQLLVLKCQTGDRRALEDLYRRYNARLGYYLRRLLGDEAAAADVQQEVWLSVIRRVGGLRNPAAFPVWLYQVARRKALDRVGRDRPTVPLEEEAVEGTSGAGARAGAQAAALA